MKQLSYQHSLPFVALVVGDEGNGGGVSNGKVNMEEEEKVNKKSKRAAAAADEETGDAVADLVLIKQHFNWCMQMLLNIKLFIFLFFLDFCRRDLQTVQLRLGKRQVNKDSLKVLITILLFFGIQPYNTIIRLLKIWEIDSNDQIQTAIATAVMPLPLLESTSN